MFMLHQFTEVDSFFSFVALLLSVSARHNLINAAFVPGVYALFNPTHYEANATYEI